MVSELSPISFLRSPVLELYCYNKVSEFVIIINRGSWASLHCCPILTEAGVKAINCQCTSFIKVILSTNTPLPLSLPQSLSLWWKWLTCCHQYCILRLERLLYGDDEMWFSFDTQSGLLVFSRTALSLVLQPLQAVVTAASVASYWSTVLSRRDDSSIFHHYSVNSKPSLSLILLLLLLSWRQLVKRHCFMTSLFAFIKWLMPSVVALSHGGRPRIWDKYIDETCRRLCHSWRSRARCHKMKTRYIRFGFINHYLT